MNLVQRIVIDQPLETVFAFCINPANTPKWVDSILAEETNEWPVTLGTIYRNQDTTGEWSEYTLTLFELNKAFTLTQADGYYLRYTFAAVNDETTELLYEWPGKDESELTELHDILQKLKAVIEGKR